MKPFEEDLPQTLTMVADEADTRALERIRQDILGQDIQGGTADTAQRVRRWRHRLAAIAAGSAAAAVTITALNLTGTIGGTSEQPGAVTADAIPPNIKPGEPCINARKLPLDKLVDMSRTPVWMPSTSRANWETLTGTWVCSGAVLTLGISVLDSSRPETLVTPRSSGRT